MDFAKGQRKDDVMHEHLAAFQAAGRTEGVVFIGRAQEKTPLFRTEKRRDHEGKSYPWIVKTTGVVNHFYFYCVDSDFGPFFLKFCSYFPYNAKLCLNGNHWAQQQAARGGIGFEALDNGFAAVSDPAALQSICDRLGPAQIDALLRKWLARLPHPFTPADRQAGYRYDLSILQAEFSLTQMLDKPISGRVFFEQVIRDNLDAGRPDQVSLIFARRLMRTGPRATPGRFRTRVITSGVTPSLHVDYKHATIKQYHKEGRALRTETTINDTRDFGIGKRLTNLPALREVGFSASRRLLRLERLSHDPITGAEAITAVTGPVLTGAGTRIPGLPLAQARSHALLAALLIFRLLPRGFTNRDLRELTAGLRGLPTVTAGQITYDLRRLRSHQLIERDSPHPPLPRHRHRPAHRHDPDPHPRPRPPGRPGPTHPDHRPAQQATRCRDRLPDRHRRHHPRRRTRRLTTDPAPPAKFDSIKPTSSALALSPSPSPSPHFSPQFQRAHRLPASGNGLP